MPSPRGIAGRAAPDVRPAVRGLDPAEILWLEESRELLRGPGLDLTDVERLGALLDELMTAWHAAEPVERWDPLPTITALGLLTGDAVVARVPGLGWVRVEGTASIALAHPRTTALALPLDAVAGLWDAGVPGGLPPLVHELTDATLARVADAEDPPRLPGALRLLGRLR